MATVFSPPQSVEWLNQRKAAYLETHAKTRHCGLLAYAVGRFFFPPCVADSMFANSKVNE